MTATRQRVLERIWRGHDPFAGFPTRLYENDTQGWNSHHPYLTDSIDKVGPSPVIVEIGVWKGGSVMTMANRMKELGLDGCVIAIDTWLGAWDHWISPEWFEELSMSHGRPAIQNKFMSNIVQAGLTDYVLPLPLDSLNALQVLTRQGVVPNIIHVDGGHDYQAVTSDITGWWPTIAPGGVLIGDDYDEVSWPEVKRAFDDYFASDPGVLEICPNKCRVIKSM